MILNEQINRIIKIMLEIDDEFKNQYANFVKKLPPEIIEKCRKNEDFLGNTDDTNNYYDYYYNIIEDHGELEVELANGEEYSLSVGNILIKDLLKAPITTIEKDDFYWEFGALTYTNVDGYRIDYSFRLKRISKDKFTFTMHKYEIQTQSCLPEKETKTTSKELTFSEFVKKVKMNTTKR